MKTKIVMDSAGDLQQLTDVDFTSVPLKIVAGDREFVDNSSLDVAEMVAFLRQYKGKTSSACPGVGEYLEAFGDAENVYCITITSGLSGSYNAAMAAAQAYKEQYPDRKVHVLDSLSASAEMTLLAEKVSQLVLDGKKFEEVVSQSRDYLKSTRLCFCLESLHNLANNGRVPVAVAKVIGVLDMRLIGIASEKGTLQPTGKARGERKVVPELMKKIEGMGYVGGKLRISHCLNEKAANALMQAVLEKFPAADVAIRRASGLCSFYAEDGGLLIGLETNG